MNMTEAAPLGQADPALDIRAAVMSCGAVVPTPVGTFSLDLVGPPATFEPHDEEEQRS